MAPKGSWCPACMPLRSRLARQDLARRMLPVCTDFGPNAQGIEIRRPACLAVGNIFLAYYLDVYRWHAGTDGPLFAVP